LPEGQCRGRRWRELHRKAPGAQITPELLAKQGLNVGLVIDDEDVNAQFVPPASACAAAVRGSVMMNSVNAPGSVLTSPIRADDIGVAALADLDLRHPASGVFGP
jgi:hypothetical protein